MVVRSGAGLGCGMKHAPFWLRKPTTVSIEYRADLKAECRQERTFGC